MTMYGFLKKYEMYKEVANELLRAEPNTIEYQEILDTRIDLGEELYEGFKSTHVVEMVVSYIFDSEEHDFNRECPQTWLLEFKGGERDNNVCKLVSEVYKLWDRMHDIENSPNSDVHSEEYDKLIMDSVSLSGTNARKLRNLILDDYSARSFVSDWLCDCVYMSNSPDLEPQLKFLLEMLQFN